MDDIIAKIGWKKVAIFAVAASLIGILFVIVSFQNDGSGRGGQNGKNPQPNSGSTGQSGSGSNTGTSNGNVVKGSFSVPGSGYIKTPYYALDYPTYYTMQSIPQKDALSYSELSDNSRNLKIKITVYDASTASLDALEKPFFGTGYEPESYKLGQLDVDEYIKVADSNTYSFQKVDFLQKNGKNIKVDFSYSGTNPEFEAERDFVRLLSSIQ